MTKNITGAVFDLDGVIVDTARYHYLAWKRMANELGFDFSPAQNEELKGVSRTESMNRILAWGNRVLSEAEKERHAAQKNQWYLDYIREMAPDEILPGVMPFLEGLKSLSVKMAIGSSSKNARTIIERIGLQHYFDSIVDGNRITHSKPHPEVFLTAARELGLDPSECMVFEDAEAGVEAAVRGGFHVIGVGDPAILGKAGAVIPSLEGCSWADLVERVRVLRLRSA